MLQFILEAIRSIFIHPAMSGSIASTRGKAITIKNYIPLLYVHAELYN